MLYSLALSLAFHKCYISEEPTEQSRIFFYIDSTSEMGMSFMVWKLSIVILHDLTQKGML